MATNWKYTDDTKLVVQRINEDGYNVSCFASVLDPSIVPDDPDAAPAASGQASS